ncbi:hypothetical protein RF11_12734 [Thelohanellus kitauei]|uniref:Uncharacterized protein n=1 Tax=Thelohanellus kitauei TaxID=669202 RepID=A0A0C2MSH8_THEKT|nr:hypothetical protein RF11_12734 [Thelohanellus kitauei]
MRFLNSAIAGTRSRKSDQPCSINILNIDPNFVFYVELLVGTGPTQLSDVLPAVNHGNYLKVKESVGIKCHDFNILNSFKEKLRNNKKPNSCSGRLWGSLIDEQDVSYPKSV